MPRPIVVAEWNGRRYNARLNEYGIAVVVGAALRDEDVTSEPVATDRTGDSGEPNAGR